MAEHLGLDLEEQPGESDLGLEDVAEQLRLELEEGLFQVQTKFFRHPL